MARGPEALQSNLKYETLNFNGFTLFRRAGGHTVGRGPLRLFGRRESIAGSYVYDPWPEIVDVRGRNGPSPPKDPREKAGARPPPFPAGFWEGGGRFNPRFSVVCGSFGPRRAPPDPGTDPVQQIAFRRLVTHFKFVIGSGPENGHGTALELVSGAHFVRVLHHVSSPTRWNGSRGQVRPETGQKPNKSCNLYYLF
jgi:hypothetical protein